MQIMGKETTSLLIFRVNDQSFAIPLDQCLLVLPSMELIPLPQALEFAAGMIQHNDSLIPVVDLRRIFRLTEKEISLSDHFLVVEQGAFPVALWVDHVEDIIRLQKDRFDQAQHYFISSIHVKGVCLLDNQTIFLQDLAQLLSDDQINLLKDIIHP